MSVKRERFRVVAAVIVLIFTAVSACLDCPAALSSTTTKIAVIGDSYTAGSAAGGNGPNGWPVLAGQLLAREGVEVDADIAAEGGAGYGQRGSRGNIFQDLTAQAVRRNDALVVFFGSRNDEPVDPQTFPALAAGTFQLARFAAPAAKILVIGPPWPTASPPPAVLKTRDSLRDQAALAGAAFIDPIAEGWFVGRPNLIGPDGVHPTNAGHVYLAEKIAPLIFDQLTIAV
jgi:hypothetical protein